MEAKGGGEGKKGDGRPAQKIGENEKGHSLGNAGVVGVPGLRTANGAVHLQVATHEDDKCDAVDEHEEDYVGQAGDRVGLERETYGKLSKSKKEKFSGYTIL